MPFKSERQRRYLYANVPAVAKKFAKETKKRRTRKSGGRKKGRT